MTKHTQGLILLLLAQVLVALNIISSKLLVTAIPILLLLSIRFSLASVVLLPLHWLTPDKKVSIKTHLKKLSRKDWCHIFLQAMSAGIFFNCLMLLGLNYTDANIAGIITSSLPAIIALMARIILKIKMTPKQIGCILFATLGLIIIASAKSSTHLVSHSFLGEFLVLLSLVPEAAYYILAQMHPIKLPVFLFSSLMNGVNALCLFPIALLLNTMTLSLNYRNIFILGILGLNTGLFYVLWFFGMQKIDSVTASITTALMPVATVIFAYLFLNEYMNLPEFLGMAFVLISIGIYARK